MKFPDGVTLETERLFIRPLNEEEMKNLADSYIEKESYLRRDEYRHIFVVTSDGPEQSQILGNGAYRVPVSDLMRAMEEDKALQSKFITRNNHKNLRSEIGRAIPISVQEKLDKLRGR